MMESSQTDISSKPNTSLFISLVIPVYNEEDGIQELYQQLIGVIKPLAYRYEIIFVDDGSSDNTSSLILNLGEKNPHVKMISLARNYGHQIALTAGLHHASGDIAITMDADLQHPPQLIPQMIQKWSEGYDVVYMTKITQEKRGLVKRLVAYLFYKIFSRISDIKLDPNASDFRLISRRVLELLNGMPEQQRFIRGLVSWVGFRQTRIPYAAPSRFAGQPKYGLRRLAQLASYGIASFSTLPLRAPLYLGLPLTLFSCSYGIYLVVAAFFGVPLSEVRLVLVGITLLGGLLFAFLGIMGSYMAKIYQEVRKRPLYTIKKIVGFATPYTGEGIQSHPD